MENIVTSCKQMWFGKSLPRQHISFKTKHISKDLSQKLRIYTKRGIYHPLKRKIARYYLILLKKIFKIRVIGITGSAGKTTTKEMLASILRIDSKVVSSFKNIDPVYNIPDTILKVTPRTKYLILEMGVEYPGEMDYYLWLVRPDIGVITNIYPTHTEFFESVEGVRKEKTKLIQKLDKNNFAVLNFNDTNLKKSVKDIKAKVVWFNRESQINAKDIKFKDDLTTSFELNIFSKRQTVNLPTIGKQFVENALAASAVAYVLGIKFENIKHGLEKYELPEHRMKFIKTKEGAVLVDDSYNNNPEAAKKTISIFCEIAKDRKKIIVFGDMLELGDRKNEYHREIGDYIIKNKVDYLIGVGELSKITVMEAKEKMGKNKIFWVKSGNQVKKIINKIIDKDSYVLVKGSRSIGLDRLVDELS